MPFETTLTYSEPLLRRAVFVFWRRTLGAGIFVAIALVAICLAILIAQGVLSWVVGAAGAVLAMAAALPITGYVVHYRNTISKFREMGEPEATFRADESTFTVSSGIGTSTLPWSTFKEIWQFRDFWILLFSKAQFSTLPTSGLSSEMQAFILCHVRATGGKVR
jgi:hypothetical protein